MLNQFRTFWIEITRIIIAARQSRRGVFSSVNKTIQEKRNVLKDMMMIQRVLNSYIYTGAHLPITRCYNINSGECDNVNPCHEGMSFKKASKRQCTLRPVPATPTDPDSHFKITLIMKLSSTPRAFATLSLFPIEPLLHNSSTSSCRLKTEDRPRNRCVDNAGAREMNLNFWGTWGWDLSIASERVDGKM